MSDSGRLLVHSGLRQVLSSLIERLATLGYVPTFVAAAALASEMSDDLAMLLLPASNEDELRVLRALRPLYCLIPIAAVVSDSIGLPTYEAVKAGATSVINLLLPPDRQFAAATFQLTARPFNDGLPATGRPVQHEEDVLPMCAEQVVLIKALCSDKPVAELAKLAYCSERSMYRRIRVLYEQLGVTSRAELRLTVHARADRTLRALPEPPIGTCGLIHLEDASQRRDPDLPTTIWPRSVSD